MAGPLLPHGGILSAARRRFPGAPRPLIDLSTGINRIAYPVGPLPEVIHTLLPDPDDVVALEAAAATAYGVNDPAMVIAAPGTQILIGLLPWLLPEIRTVAVLSPTYGEHLAAWQSAGRQVTAITNLSAVARSDCLVICNPNNPDGRMVEPARLLELAADLAARTGILLIDEAFADFEDNRASVVRHLPHASIVVLRSFGKSFGLAGVRLGFAIVPGWLANRVRRALGPWPVSSVATEVGRRALVDARWVVETADRLAQDGSRLDVALAETGLKLIGGTKLFRLYDSSDAGSLADHLGNAGILVRAFAGHPTWLRFGIPGHEDEWQRLQCALALFAQSPRSGNTPRLPTDDRTIP